MNSFLSIQNKADSQLRSVNPEWRRQDSDSPHQTPIEGPDFPFPTSYTETIITTSGRFSNSAISLSFKLIHSMIAKNRTENGKATGLWILECQKPVFIWISTSRKQHGVAKSYSSSLSAIWGHSWNQEYVHCIRWIGRWYGVNRGCQTCSKTVCCWV